MVTILTHQGKISGNNGLNGGKWNHLAVVANSGAGGVVCILVNVLTQHIPQYFEVNCIAAREKCLTYAAADEVKLIICNFLLVFAPNFLFYLVAFHGSCYV